MFVGILFVCLIIVGAVSGKALLLALSAAPIVGVLAGWYFHFVPDLGSGTMANMVYGAMALQVVLFALFPALYGPKAVRGFFACVRQRRQKA